jgi:hypothetical protein
MVTANHKPPSSGWLNRVKPALVVIAGIAVLMQLVVWGGTATTGPLFILGVAALLGVMLTFAALIYWLFISPMPAPVTGTHSSRWRELAGVLAVSSGLMFSMGLLWDEIWHRRYGGFGNDFLWPPHFLLYGSLSIIAVCATGGLAWIAVRSQGTWRQRFRSESLIGLLGLTAAYLTFNAPVDALWHEIYGVDITAWSLPHLTLFGGMAVVLMISMPLVLSNLPKSGWRQLEGMRWQEWLAVLLGGFALSLFLQLGTTEWEGIRQIRVDNATANGFWLRPEWLYPVVVTSIAMLIGFTTSHTLRRVGAATLVGLIPVGLRVVSIAVFDADDLNISLFSQLIVLPALLLIDLLHALQRRRSLEPRWSLAHSLAVGAAFLAVCLPVIATQLVYPRVNAGTLPGMIFWSLVMAVACSWVGASLGAWLAQLGRSTSALSAPRQSSRAALGALALASVVVTLVVVTARPPA